MLKVMEMEFSFRGSVEMSAQPELTLMTCVGDYSTSTLFGVFGNKHDISLPAIL